MIFCVSVLSLSLDVRAHCSPSELFFVSSFGATLPT